MIIASMIVCFIAGTAFGYFMDWLEEYLRDKFS